MLLSLSFANPMTPYSKAYQVNLNNWLLLNHVYGYINRDDILLIPFLIIADLPRPLKATQIPPLKRNGYTISDNTDHPRLYGRGVSAPTILSTVYVWCIAPTVRAQILCLEPVRLHCLSLVAFYLCQLSTWCNTVIPVVCDL